MTLRVLLLVAVLCTSAHAGVLDLPSLDRALHYRPKQPLTVLTADGTEIAAFGAERRRFVPIEQIPRLLQDAVIAVEDARFREHGGIDPKGMARAAVALMTGGLRQGASTITQQVARVFFLEQRFTAERKTQEILIALELEKRLSKDKILELYMNEIFLGQRAYGFAAAAQTYFAKPLDALSIAEVAMLAGLPQNPHYANPVTNFERAQQRQRLVLERMRVTGVITDEQQRAARAQVLVIRNGNPNVLHAGHVAEMARAAVVERFGDTAYTRGFKVTTSIVAAEQRAAWDSLRRGVLAHDRRGAWRGVEATERLPAGDGPELEAAAARALKHHRDDEMLRVAIVLGATPKALQLQLASGERIRLAGEGLRWAQAGLAPRAKPALRLERGAVLRVIASGKTWQIAQWPQAEAAFVAMHPATGRVRALVGAFDFGRQPFNHVTQAWRQPGSAIKPLLYSAALEHGVMPDTVIEDLPYTSPDGWAPANSDGQFLGDLSLREALAKSRNAVSVRVLQHSGVAASRDWLQRFGLDAAKQPDNLTLALGSGSLTPLQMAQAYGVIANGGWRLPPVVIERIVDAQGRSVFEATQPTFGEDTRAIPARNAWLTASLLNDVTKTGTAARAQAVLKRSDLYGKTGTTNDAVDAWFAGFQPGLVAVAWVGHGEPRSLGERESGGGLALPIWIDFMARALKGVPVAAAAAPPEGLMRSGDDWLYEEWAVQGHVARIGADGHVLLSQPFAPLPPAVLTEAPAPAQPALR